MRIDVVSIFPGYLGPLDLSLPGKARERGVLELGVHDLRGWTHDRHRTVDDTPYGGGAGMVMRPEPWGEALDELAGAQTTVVVPTPSGTPFRQEIARELATRTHLLFVCGRYEGIDQRVLDHVADRYELREISLGDYVLNGGEAAALAIIEAVVRLLPGFMGNPDSLVEESHEAGLLEPPAYTKPPVWRGREVPEVLRGGHHAQVAAWRHEQAVRRTAARRPDLLHPSRVVGGWTVVPAVRADAPELLTLQLACWVREAIANDTLAIPALHEDLATVERGIEEWRTFVVRSAGRLVGSVRGRLDGREWDVGRLMVAPDLRGRGLGRLLLEHAQLIAPPEATAYRLHTGGASEDNIRMYRRAGFSVRGRLPGHPDVLVLTKPRRR